MAFQVCLHFLPYLLLAQKKTTLLVYSFYILFSYGILCNSKQPARQGLPAQRPDNTDSSAFHALDKVVAWVQLEHRVDSHVLVIRTYLLGILQNCAQDRILGFALLITQRKVHTIRPTLWLVGEDLLFYTGKPEGAGHAAHPGKQVCLIDGIQSEQPGQRVPGNPSPARNFIDLFLCRWDELLGQKPQLGVRAASAGVYVFESGWTIPRGHIVVPVQVTDSHQRERRAAGSLCGIIYLFSFARECVEIDNWGFWFGA